MNWLSLTVLFYGVGLALTWAVIYTAALAALRRALREMRDGLL